MLRHVLPALVALALGMLAPVPATAAPARGPGVTAQVSSTRVAVGEPVRVSGRVRAAGGRATVVLQRRVDGGWKRVARTRVRVGTPYSLRTRVPRGKHRLRVRVPRTGTRAALTSPVVRVRGLAPSSTQPPTQPPTAADPELDRVRALVLQQTNALRAGSGLPPVRPMAALDGVAQSWTEQMAATGRFDHNPQFSAQYPRGWTRAGENIAVGYVPESVVKGWTDSPGHRANMLGDYTHLGIGFARDASGRAYYTQNFGRY